MATKANIFKNDKNENVLTVSYRGMTTNVGVVEMLGGDATILFGGRNRGTFTMLTTEELSAIMIEVDKWKSDRQ